MSKILQFKRPAPPIGEVRRENEAPVKPSYPNAPDPALRPLKPCPFCGAPARLSRPERVGAGSIDVACYIACVNQECNVTTRYFYKKNTEGFNEVIDAWNRRV